MKKITFLLLLVITYSCKKENEPYTMYGFLTEEFAYSSAMLKIQINESLANDKLTNNKLAKSYDSLTIQYLNYLDIIYIELINKAENSIDYNGELSKKKYVNELFFNGDKHNEKGKEFIFKTENYRTEILKLVNDKVLEKRINGTINTMDIRDREGERIKYLNYLYQDMPLISVLAHMLHKKKSILELENDFLKIIQLNE